MHPFYPVKDLVSDQQSGLEGEGSTTECEQLLKAWAVKITDKDAVIVLNPIPVEVRDALSAFDDAVELGLSLQGTLLGRNRLQFNSQFSLRIDFEAKVDLRVPTDADSG